MKNFFTENDIHQIIHYYEEVIFCMPGNVYILDENCTMVSCNENVLKMCGLNNTRQFKGLSFTDLGRLCHWPEHITEKFKYDSEKVIRSGIPQSNIEEPPVTSFGKAIYFLTSRVPLRDNTGKVVGLVGISVDIAERKKMEIDLQEARKQAEAASQAKSEFIANMSHDLRTPLAGMIAMAHDMLNAVNAQDKIEHKQLVRRIKNDCHIFIKSSNELLQTCNQILEAAQIEFGKSAPITSTFNINDLIKHNIKLSRPIARHKKISLSYEFDPHLPYLVIGLYDYLDRTILNLLSNALKFTQKGFVKITIESLTDNPHVYEAGNKISLKISIKDTGIGIPQDKSQAIFERFSRLTASYQGIYKGNGLGLYAVKHYVDAMNGKIEVQSELGKGSTFIITIPFILANKTDKSTSSLKKLKSLSKRRKIKNSPEKSKKRKDKILIVEDHVIAAVAVKSMLRSYNIKSDVAKNGMEALQLITKNHYDLILMDIGLADISGFEVAKQIRLNKLAAETPIVALTGHATDDDKLKYASESDVQEIITKPAQMDDLERILNNYVYSKQR